jgi:putative tryptophan/tyrosine transport system substrate-binding protein
VTACPAPRRYTGGQQHVERDGWPLSITSHTLAAAGSCRARAWPGWGCWRGVGGGRGRRKPPPKVYRLGAFHVGADHVPPPLPGLRQGLQVLGYVQGQNLELDWRNLVDETAASATAEQFVRERKDLLVAFEPDSVRAAKVATTEIPIVFLAVDEPVASALVQSFAHPGGNLTGIAGCPLLLSKGMEFFKELLPRLERLLGLVDPDDPVTPAQLAEARSAARLLRIALVERIVRGQAEIPYALAALTPGDVQGVVIISLRLMNSGSTILRAALDTGLPLGAQGQRRLAAEGALFNYGPNPDANGRAVARHVDKILRGAKPADIPVENRDILGLVVNLRTAETLGLTIPQHMLLQTTEVIQ